MRSDLKTYEAVAVRCDSFSPISSPDTFSNSSSVKSNVSCINCKHFTNEKYCELNLYDQIVANNETVDNK